MRVLIGMVRLVEFGEEGGDSKEGNQGKGLKMVGLTLGFDQVDIKNGAGFFWA